MPSTTTYEKWDVVLVSFPFTDFTALKRRPAIVVSPNAVNSGDDFTLLFVTSRLTGPPRIGDHRIVRWKEAGFPKPSLARMKFVTAHKSVIVKRFGRLEIEDQQAIEAILTSFFTS